MPGKRCGAVCRLLITSGLLFGGSGKGGCLHPRGDGAAVGIPAAPVARYELPNGPPSVRGYAIELWVSLISAAVALVSVAMSSLSAARTARLQHELEMRRYDRDREDSADGPEDPRGQRCLDYVQFVERRENDVSFGRWFARLGREIDSLPHSSSRDLDRLARVQEELVSVIEFLDPDGTRFPAAHRQRIPQHHTAPPS